MTWLTHTDRVLTEIESSTDEIVAFAADLVRIPTVNPPGEHYEACAHLLGDRLDGNGFEVQYLVATGRPEHTSEHPRVNVLGRLETGAGPVVHLNGHLDVVPAGDGWTVDPFGGVVRAGRLYGRGSTDMKAGIAAAVYAVEALRRVGASWDGTVEVSGTVDEESGGFAGVGWMAEQGYLSASNTDVVIIPEPFGPDRVCIGHRGVYWFDLETRGRTAHGSMPFLGVNAIDQMSLVLDAVRDQLSPRLEDRLTTLPVVPPGARHATINLNTIVGGQVDGGAVQSPCVPDRCTATFDRRFLPEESIEHVRGEIEQLLTRTRANHPGLRCELRDRMVVLPVQTPQDAPVVRAVAESIKEALGTVAAPVASPGTYDHKHVTRIAGIEQCVAYGPGALELAHQPDEYCEIDDLVRATQVLALALLKLLHRA